MPNINAPSTMSIPALPSPHDMQFFCAETVGKCQADLAASCLIGSEYRPLNRRFLGTPIKEQGPTGREYACSEPDGLNFRKKNEVIRFSRDLRRLEREWLAPESPPFSSLLRGQKTNRVIRQNRL